MQGIGFLIAVFGYGLIFTGYQQGFGDGGSFLYWITGNEKLGKPSTPSGTANSNPNNPHSPGYYNKYGGTIGAAKGGTGIYNMQHGGGPGVPGK